MGKRLREGSGGILVVASLLVVALSVTHVRDQEYVGAVLLLSTGLSFLRAAVELLRPSMGE